MFGVRTLAFRVLWVDILALEAVALGSRLGALEVGKPCLDLKEPTLFKGLT